LEPGTQTSELAGQYEAAWADWASEIDGRDWDVVLADGARSSNWQWFLSPEGR
jgi:hypothetical protein